MRIERLVAMANDIGTFFEAESGRDDAPGSIATHLARFWDPRMRRQLIAYQQDGGSGLNDVVHAAVALLAAERR
jgi:formate dehydrogenase subunit delta